MGILGDALSAIAGFIDGIASLIPGMSSNPGAVASAVNTVDGVLSKANNIFPVDTVGTVLALMIGRYIALNAFYWIQRAINLLRGSG